MTTSLTSSPTRAKAIGSEATSTDYPARPRTRRSAIWYIVGIVVAGLFGGGGWMVASWSRALADVDEVDKFAVHPRTFSVVLKEKGELQAARSTEIISEVEGRTTIISLVPEGTAVKKGDLLVELASDQVEDRIRSEELRETNAVTTYEASVTELEIQRDKNASDIRKADLEIELMRLALAKYQKGDWVEKSKDADIRIQEAGLMLSRTDEVWQAAQELYDRGYMTKTAHDNDEFSYQKAKWELDKAVQAKEILWTYTHVADLRRRESDLQEAIKEFERVKKNANAEEIKKVRAVEGKKRELDLLRDQLAKLRRQKEKSRITAPTQGIVVYYSGGGGRHFMSSDSQIREGATVHERQIIMTLPDTSDMLVIVRVHEAKTDKLRLGQAARIRVEGIPGREFTGKVTKIAAVADSQNRWLNPDLKEYETEITLDSTDVPLKPGVTAHVEILVERVTDVLAVPVQAVYAKKGRRYVFRMDHQDAQPVEIQLGAIGTEWAEVSDGLLGGERILLAFNDEHLRMIPDLPNPARAGEHRGSGRPKAPQAGGSPGGRPGVDRTGRSYEGASRGRHGGADTQRGDRRKTSDRAGQPPKRSSP